MYSTKCEWKKRKGVMKQEVEGRKGDRTTGKEEVRDRKRRRTEGRMKGKNRIFYSLHEMLRLIVPTGAGETQISAVQSLVTS